MGESRQLYKYLANADPSEGTAEIVFDDDRPNLVLGSDPGELSDEEVQNLSQRLVLEAVDENSEEGKRARAAVEERRQAADPNADLEGANKTELETIADREGVDLAEAKNNEQRADAIRQAREGGDVDPLNPGNLPATATAGPTPPSPGGGGGAAGPGGSGGGGLTTGTTTGGGDTATG
jgi:predicted  nucleic acid-binding Zn-ribbon protein